MDIDTFFETNYEYFLMFSASTLAKYKGLYVDPKSAEAGDPVHDMYIKVTKPRESGKTPWEEFSGPDSYRKTWICQGIKNQIRDMIKSSYNRNVSLVDPTSHIFQSSAQVQPKDIELNESERQVVKFLEQIRPYVDDKIFKVVLLRSAGLIHREIAPILGIGRAASEYRIRKAREVIEGLDCDMNELFSPS